MSLTMNSFLPLFGHNRTYPTQRPRETRITDFAFWSLSNLAGTNHKTLAKFTGLSPNIRLEILYNKTRDIFFEYFEMWEYKDDASFGMMDDSKIAEFLKLLKQKGLVNMPEVTNEVHKQQLAELGLLDGPEELLAPPRRGRSKELKLKPPKKRIGRPPKAKAEPAPTNGRRVGRPPSPHLETIHWDKLLKAGPKKAVPKARAALEVQNTLKAFGRKRVTAQQLMEKLVQEGWGRTAARSSIIRFLRTHQYITYA